MEWEIGKARKCVSDETLRNGMQSVSKTNSCKSSQRFQAFKSAKRLGLRGDLLLWKSFSAAVHRKKKKIGVSPDNY